MSSGVRKSYRGSFVGTGASQDIKVVGFKPKSVKLMNVGALGMGEWTESMAEGSMFKQITDGTTTFITTQGITPLASGFNVGTDAVANGAGNIVHYEATE
jgi:hypothetical protein